MPGRPDSQLKEAAAEYEAALDAQVAAMPIPDGFQELARDDNYRAKRLRHFRFRGTVLNTWHVLLRAPERWARFRPRSSDVFVASFPKSGTTWLQEIVWLITHGGAGEDDGQPLEYRFPLFDLPSTADMPLRALEDMPSPRLAKTHLPHHLLPAGVRAGAAKVLYIERDPRDVCVSYYHFCRMVTFNSYRGTFAQFRDAFVRGEVMYGPYREHVRGYREHSDTVLCLTYEQLHRDRIGCVRRIAAFLEQPMSDELAERICRRTTFDVMKRNPGVNFEHWYKNGMAHAKEEVGSAFMRKGRIGDWTNYFTEEEGEAFLRWAREEP